MSIIENTKIAEDQKKVNVTDNSQHVVVNNEVNKNQSAKKVAILSQLDELTGILLETSQAEKREVEKIEEKLNDVKDSKSKSSKDEIPKGHISALYALIAAGIKEQKGINDILKKLALGGEQIEKLTTEAALAGQDWMTNFYEHGTTAGVPGSTAASSKGIPGAQAKGASGSTEFNELVGQYQYVQQKVSQINGSYQSLASVPAVMSQSLTQAVNTANSGQKNTIKALDITKDLINTWKGN